MKNLLLLIDIETVPIVSAYSELSKSWQELWEKKAKFFYSEEYGKTPEELWEKRAAIYAEFAKVVCIGLGVLDTRHPEDPHLYLNTLSGDDETSLLQSFVSEVATIQKKYPASTFAGHNICEFDLPFLCRRMLVRQIAIPYFMPRSDAKPWDFFAYDTLRHWRFGDHKNFISLNLLAHVLDIPTSKSQMEGSQVAHYYYEKKDLPAISEYCKQDIILTAQVILRFEGRQLLGPEAIKTFSIVK